MSIVLEKNQEYVITTYSSKVHDLVLKIFKEQEVTVKENHTPDNSFFYGCMVIENCEEKMEELKEHQFRITIQKRYEE